MRTELHDEAEVRHHIAANGGMDRTVLQGLDIRGLDSLGRSADDAVLLGCRMSEAQREWFDSQNVLVIPRLADRPYRPYRSRLYSQGELLEGFDPAKPRSYWDDSRDGRIYNHQVAFRRDAKLPIMEAMAQRLHDLSIDDALAEFLGRHQSIVAVMGGHNLKRGDSVYWQAALLGRRLAQIGCLVTTGGGPGAMEAANLGAWLSQLSLERLADATQRMAVAADFKTDAYIQLAHELRSDVDDGHVSLAIPTWFYGHEPTNAFATHVAKYFSNSLREDGLLAIATGGVVFMPGSAGTVQEIFMDATQNHYEVFDEVSPMVLFGRQYWEQTLPVVELLRTLALGRRYASQIAVVDTVDEAADFIQRQSPSL